jgi:hypothetical protein
MSDALQEHLSTLPCIEFTGPKRRNGYGYTQFLGKQVLAHRLAYAVNNYLMPESLAGVVIRHRCDNRSCINVDHLLPGSHADNMRDKVERNRQHKGEQIKQHKLTEEQVCEVRSLYRPRQRGLTQRELATRYGVSQSAISLVITGRNWRHTKEEA